MKTKNLTCKMKLREREVKNVINGSGIGISELFNLNSKLLNYILKHNLKDKEILFLIGFNINKVVNKGGYNENVKSI